MIRGLYGIADDSFGDPVRAARWLVEGGACAVQVRCKGASTQQIAEHLLALGSLGVPLLVNDHPELAELADGVHLGQEDGPFPPRCGLRGRSTHSLDQLRRAMDEGVDYVGFGPIFPTSTKSNAGAPLGLALLEQAVGLSTVPIVAIGGIGPEALPALRETGVAAWAIVSAILGAPDVVAAARRCA